MTLQCMLDVETLSTNHNAVILSIGAVKFNDSDAKAPHGMPFVDEFHTGVTLASYENMVGGQFAFDITPGTVEFWLSPKQDRARMEWLNLEKVDLATALQAFSMWYAGQPADPDDETRPAGIWSNGATFDIPIMRNAFKLLGLPCPWHFREENCYRTIFNRFAKLVPDPVTAGPAHDALSDARWQAHKLQMMLVAMRGDA